ncbi:MAG: preprotein translocase subunit SecG [Deltaproteobacteria bacterium]|nr:preprotein translocase subunit SecG [Deltaproteobacteria bacterium]
MQTVLVVIHLVICVALIMIVLLQTGKGSEIGAVFGSSSQTLFGSTGGSTFFSKLTAGVAIVFLITSLILAGRSSRATSESIMSGVKPAATAPAATEIETPSGAPAVETEKQTGAEEKTKSVPPAESPAAKEEVPAPPAGDAKKN